ncbi:hypothetical protein SPONL_2096 [uncultured Candidatus Thioglobus sp.]|nr:hypothetical protein SPONL_2096 [uncultured Candidatus Thioglobus sp.]
MDLIYDPAKNASNIIKHGISFTEVAEFDFASALIIKDERLSYGEDRFTAYGYLNNRLYFLCFVVRNNQFRVISFRKANKREAKFYATTNQ